MVEVRRHDVLGEQRRQHEDQQAAGVDEQPAEHAIRARRVVLPRQSHEHRAEADAEDARPQHDVRRAQDLDVQAVGVVPPVVEGRRYDHRQRAPDADPGPERSAEAPERDAGGPLARVAGERRAQHEPSAREAGDDAAQVDGQVGGRPERVAADGAVPGDVPQAADDDAGRRERDGPQVPGNGGRRGSRAGIGEHRCRCRLRERAHLLPSVLQEGPPGGPPRGGSPRAAVQDRLGAVPVRAPAVRSRPAPGSQPTSRPCRSTPATAPRRPPG